MQPCRAQLQYGLGARKFLILKNIEAGVQYLKSLNKMFGGENQEKEKVIFVV